MREYKIRLNPKGVIKMEAVYSRFSMRMRIAAISLLMVFFSQQVSWACAGNLSLLVNLPPSPLIYQDHGEFNRLVANRVYSLAKPSFRQKHQELKSAYQWLKQPSTQTVPCSAYVLYNLLQAKGIKPKIEDISASLISLDLKAGNLKPPFTASRIDNSLYALAKTAESQGILLYPFRLNSITPELLNSLNSQTPFIAHLNYSEALDKGHFVLVTGIDADKVHFLYDKGDTFLPLEKFLEEFSGYCLLSLASVGDSLPAVSDVEAQGVLGAKSYKGVKVDYTKLFKEPSTTDLLIGFGVSMGAMFGGSMLGGMMKGQGLSFGKAFAGLGAGIAQAEISKASVNFSVQQFKMKPEYAQIVGYGVSGAMSGAMAGIGNNGQFKIGSGENFWNNHSIMRGAIMGSVQGGMQGGSSVLAYQGIKNTSFYKDNPFIARQAAGLLGSAVGYMGFYAMTGAMRMNVNIDKNNNKVFGEDQKGTQVTYSDGSTRIRMSTFDNGGAGILNNVKFALADSSFLSSMISQGTALGVEWAAGPKYAKYSRILGQGIGSVAGGYATGNGISPWKMMMSGALSGGISLGLGYLGGEVGPDGKNKLGLTDIQMAGIEWLGTATIYAGAMAVQAKAMGGVFADEYRKQFVDFSTNYVTFGRTSPLYTQGAGGWSSFMYNQKIADFGGFANYKANADYSMKLQGYKSWSKFVDDGKAANLLPSFSNSLVRYASATLHQGAVDNSIAFLGAILPYSATKFLGIEKRIVLNKRHLDLTRELSEEVAKLKVAIDNDEVKEINDRVNSIRASFKKDEELNGAIEDKWYSWGGIRTEEGFFGENWFTLGGSRIGLNKDKRLDSLVTHMRKGLETSKGVYSGNKYYKLGETYESGDFSGLSGEAIPIITSDKKPGEARFVNLANLLFHAKGEGYLSVGLRQTLANGDHYVGRVSTKHEKGKPTITDIFTSQKVTPKKFWFDKKEGINTGITLAVYNRPINTAQGPIYLGKDNNGLYPAAGFGYSQKGGSVSIVTKDGDKVLRSKDEMIVELSVLGQGVEKKTTERIPGQPVVAEENKTEDKLKEQKNDVPKAEGDKNKQDKSAVTELEQKVKSAEENLEKAKEDYIGKKPSTPVIMVREFLEEMPGVNVFSPLLDNIGDGDVRDKPDPDQLKNAQVELRNVKQEKGTQTEAANSQKPKGEVSLSELEKKVEQAKEKVEEAKKEYLGKAPSPGVITTMGVIEELPGGNIVVPYILKPIFGNGEGDVRVNPKEKEGNLDKAMTELTNATKELENYSLNKLAKSEVTSSEEGAKAKEEKATTSTVPPKTAPASTPQAETEEKIITTTTTPKITTAITFNKDDLSSSRDNGLPFKEGGSAYGVETSNIVRYDANEKGQSVPKQPQETSNGGVKPNEDYAKLYAPENSGYEYKPIGDTKEKYPYVYSGATPGGGNSGGKVEKTNNLREQIEQLVMAYDDQGGNLRLEQNSGIKMPQGYNISAKVNEKSRGDVINELYLYNTEFSSGKSNSTIPANQEKVIGEKRKALLPGNADTHVNAYKAATDGKKSNYQSGGKVPGIDKKALDSGLGEKPTSEETPDYFEETIQLKVEIPVEQRLGKIESYDFDVAFGSADYANGLPNTKEKVLNERAKIQDERNAKFERDADYDKKINVMPNYPENHLNPDELKDGRTKSLKWEEPTVIPTIDPGIDASFVPPSRFGELSQDLQDNYLIAVNNSPGFKKEASDNFFKLLDLGKYSSDSSNSSNNVRLIASSGE